MDSLKVVVAGGCEYQIGRIDARKQLHIVRRLGPGLVSVIPRLIGMIPNLRKLLNGEPTEMSEADQGDLITKALSLMPSVAHFAASMSDEDVDYILDHCLDVCYIRQPTGWARVRTAGTLMFSADLTLPVMMELAWEVLRENLGSFFPSELPKDAAAAPAL